MTFEPSNGRLSETEAAKALRAFSRRYSLPLDTELEDRLLAPGEVRVVAAGAADAQAALPAPAAPLSSLARASKEDLERQLSTLRLSRDLSFGYRYGANTSPEVRAIHEAADDLTLTRIAAIRRELRSREA